MTFFWTIVFAVVGFAVLIMLVKIQATLSAILKSADYFGECSKGDADQVNQALDHLQDLAISLKRIENELNSIDSTVKNVDLKLIPQ